MTIIIPTYNREQIVARAIDSALAQTYNNIEIIVVDDGSADNTREVLAGYGERIRYRNKLHGGVSSARNAGIRLARGEFLAFLDSDDEFHAHKIEKQLSYLLSHRLDFALTDISKTDPHGTVLGRSKIRKHYPHDGFTFKQIYMNQCAYIQTLLVKTTLYRMGIVSKALTMLNTNTHNLSAKVGTGNRLIVFKRVKEYSP